MQSLFLDYKRISKTAKIFNTDPKTGQYIKTVEVFQGTEALLKVRKRS